MKGGDARRHETVCARVRVCLASRAAGAARGTTSARAAAPRGTTSARAAAPRGTTSALVVVARAQAHRRWRRALCAPLRLSCKHTHKRL